MVASRVGKGILFGRTDAGNMMKDIRDVEIGILILDTDEKAIVLLETPSFKALHILYKK